MSEDSALAIHDLKSLWDSRFTTLAGITLIIYDTLLTLGVEVQYLWSKPWTHSIKSIYLFNKYLTIGIQFTTMYQLSNLRPGLTLEVSFSIIYTTQFSFDERRTLLTRNSCRTYMIYGAIAQILSEIMSKWILTLRLVAVYAQSKIIVRSLYAIYGISYLACAVFTFMAIKYNEANVFVIDIGDYCAIKSIPAIYSFIFIAPLIYELYMAILTVRKAVLHARFIKGSSSTSAPVLHVMFRDGITYFVMVAVARIVLIWLVISSGTLYLGLALQWTVDVVLVCRFYLNLLEVASSSSNVSLWGKQGFQNVTTANTGTELGDFAVNTSAAGESRSAGLTSTIVISHNTTVVDRGHQHEYGQASTSRDRSVSFGRARSGSGRGNDWATMSHSNGSGHGFDRGNGADIPRVPSLKELTTVNTPPWTDEKGKKSTDSKK
ncbi:hypothetical protein CPB86DRAFT_838678 [Serendipita vermifera]|nr:hypothetical protein CPB86DRAFT_838678 [Serendipita vermifera]